MGWSSEPFSAVQKLLAVFWGGLIVHYVVQACVHPPFSCPVSVPFLKLPCIEHGAGTLTHSLPWRALICTSVGLQEGCHTRPEISRAREMDGGDWGWASPGCLFRKVP